MAYEYELVSIKVSEGRKLYGIKTTGQHTHIAWKSYSEIQEMLSCGVQIEHLAITNRGIIKDLDYIDEAKRLFWRFTREATQTLSQFIVGNIFDVCFGVADNFFRLRTNVPYKGSNVMLDFKMGFIREPNGLFDKPPIKINVHYLIKDKELDEFQTCVVFSKIRDEQHRMGCTDYLAMQSKILILNVRDVLLKLVFMSNNMPVKDSLFSKAVYQMNAQLYVKSVAELLCARLIAKYDMLVCSSYPIYDLLDNLPVGDIPIRLFSLDSEIQGSCVNLPKHGGEFIQGIGIALPLVLSETNERACSISIRLIATSTGIALQLIKVDAVCPMHLLVDSYTLSAVYSCNFLKGDSFISVKDMGKKSVLSEIDKIVNYIGTVRRVES